MKFKEALFSSQIFHCFPDPWVVRKHLMTVFDRLYFLFSPVNRKCLAVSMGRGIWLDGNQITLRDIVGSFWDVQELRFCGSKDGDVVDDDYYHHYSETCQHHFILIILFTRIYIIADGKNIILDENSAIQRLPSQ